MPTYFEFEVSLKGIKPRIWRRFQIAQSETFGGLQRAIADSFGWDGGHLWEFMDSQHRAIAGFADDFMADLRDFGESTPAADEVTLVDYFSRARSCVYHYDFGDSWIHSVNLRERVSSAEVFKRRLLAGRRACPPEDCGGLPGYYRLVEAVETGVDPWEDDVANLREWLGDWDPVAFDIKKRRRIFDMD